MGFRSPSRHRRAAGTLPFRAWAWASSRVAMEVSATPCSDTRFCALPTWPMRHSVMTACEPPATPSTPSAYCIRPSASPRLQRRDMVSRSAGATSSRASSSLRRRPRPCGTSTAPFLLWDGQTATRSSPSSTASTTPLTHSLTERICGCLLFSTRTSTSWPARSAPKASSSSVTLPSQKSRLGTHFTRSCSCRMGAIFSRFATPSWLTLTPPPPPHFRRAALFFVILRAPACVLARRRCIQAATPQSAMPAPGSAL
mmetsp:Transcript_15508/g.46570  ORF Transcript_15508/g.46570 Transcript_15508/m.46570 type:complete len:256 (+) Transcript_15508:1168-1935(+)